jgi:hypothetical protein
MMAVHLVRWLAQMMAKHLVRWGQLREGQPRGAGSMGVMVHLVPQLVVHHMVADFGVFGNLVDGCALDVLLGSDDGCALDVLLGSDDGCALGVLLGSDDGCALGVLLGSDDGCALGVLLGSDDGCALGALLGSEDGCALGVLLGSIDRGQQLQWQRLGVELTQDRKGLQSV